MVKPTLADRHLFVTKPVVEGPNDKFYYSPSILVIWPIWKYNTHLTTIAQHCTW